jgi:hypothetical protein
MKTHITFRGSRTAARERMMQSPPVSRHMRTHRPLLAQLHRAPPPAPCVIVYRAPTVL